MQMHVDYNHKALIIAFIAYISRMFVNVLVHVNDFCVSLQV